MKLRKIGLILSILLLEACNQGSPVEERIIIYDPEKNRLFISMLDDKKVDYRIQDDGVIVYPATQKDRVLEAFEKATGKKVPEYEPSQSE